MDLINYLAAIDTSGLGSDEIMPLQVGQFKGPRNYYRDLEETAGPLLIKQLVHCSLSCWPTAH